MSFKPWHGSRTFGTVFFTLGVLQILHSILDWNFLEINRPAGLPHGVQRGLIAVMGVVFVLFGMLFFWANF